MVGNQNIQLLVMSIMCCVKLTFDLTEFRSLDFKLQHYRTIGAQIGLLEQINSLFSSINDSIYIDQPTSTLGDAI